MIFELDSRDIQIHRALAAEMEKYTLQSIIASIRTEYEELSKSLEKHKLDNHLKLLNIYAEELFSRYQVLPYNSPNTLH